MPMNCRKESVRKLRRNNKKAKQELKEKFSYDVYLPYWTNFEKMKKHFIANNESIELY